MGADALVLKNNHERNSSALRKSLFGHKLTFASDIIFKALNLPCRR